jgi:hypothetical protein
VTARRPHVPEMQLCTNERVKCLATEKKCGVLMMRQDVLGTKAATLHLLFKGWKGASVDDGWPTFRDVITQRRASVTR